NSAGKVNALLVSVQWRCWVATFAGGAPRQESQFMRHGTRPTPGCRSRSGGVALDGFWPRLVPPARDGCRRTKKGRPCSAAPGVPGPVEGPGSDDVEQDGPVGAQHRVGVADQRVAQ